MALFLAKSKTRDDSDQRTRSVHMNFGQDCLKKFFWGNGFFLLIYIPYIENIFHIVKKQLAEEEIRIRITNESFQHFQERVLRCLDSLDVETIDRTILCMPRRIERIMQAEGIRHNKIERK